MKNPIIKTGVRILRPHEFRSMVNNIKPSYQILFKTLMFTGMRYIEAQRFQNNPDWYDGDFVNLPETAMLKERRTQLERSVRLNQLGKQIIPIFLDSKIKLPSRVSWRENLRRWSQAIELPPDHLCAKTTRKTWESWLMFYYPERITEITLSQGHTTVTSIRHYLNMPFTNGDKEGMKEYVVGWID